MKIFKFMLLISLLACIQGCSDEKEEVPSVLNTEFLLQTSWNGHYVSGDSDFSVILLFMEDGYGRIKTAEDFYFRDFEFSIRENRHLSIDVTDLESTVNGEWMLDHIEKERMLFRRNSGTGGEIMELAFGTSFRLH